MSGLDHTKLTGPLSCSSSTTLDLRTASQPLDGVFGFSKEYFLEIFVQATFEAE